MNKNSRQTKKAEKGFSLIELSITLIIIGILIAPLMALYGQWQKRELVAETLKYMNNAPFVVESFNAINGRYPCPAPLNVNRTDPNYGIAADCTDTSVAINTCSPGGICVAESLRDVTAVYSLGTAPLHTQLPSCNGLLQPPPLILQTLVLTTRLP